MSLLDKKLKQSWANFTLRKQLTIVLSACLILSCLSAATVVFLVNRQTLIENSYSLLSLGQSHSLKNLKGILNEGIRTEDLKNKGLFLDRTGLGKSGETYLVSLEGRLLTESRFTTRPGISTPPPNIHSQWQGIKKDYRGIDVLAVWDKIQYGTFEAYLASEIDLEEVVIPAWKTIQLTTIFFVIFLSFVVFVTPALARLLSKNVELHQEISKTRKIALLDGQESEKNRISLELHDDIGLRLAMLSWDISSIENSTPRLLEIQSKLDELKNRVRSLSSSLSSSMVLHHGLKESCLSLLKDLKEKSKFQSLDFYYETQFSEEGLNKLDASQAILVYRCLQEICHNILKHSEATQASCYIQIFDSYVSLQAQDNGKGFNVEKITNSSKGMGLVNMRTRTDLLQAVLAIESSHIGTRVSIEFALTKENV